MWWMLEPQKGPGDEIELMEDLPQFNNSNTEEVAANAAGDLVESLLDETEGLWDKRLVEIANQEN